MKKIFVVVTTEAGELIVRLNIEAYDFSKSIACAAFMDDIREAQRRAKAARKSA